MSTNVGRMRKRERGRRRRISKVQGKRQRLRNTSRKVRVFCRFNRLSAPCGSGDSDKAIMLKSKNSEKINMLLSGLCRSLWGKTVPSVPSRLVYNFSGIN